MDKRVAKPTGFTLIELMVVVATIGVLAAVAMPTFSKFVCRSKAVEARSGLRQYYIAEHAYYGEHDEYQMDLALLSVDIEGSTKRYAYSVVEDEGSGFVLEARGIAGAGMDGDLWTLDGLNNLEWLDPHPDCK